MPFLGACLAISSVIDTELTMNILTGRGSRLALNAALAALCVGCASQQLRPAPEAQLVPNEPDVALAQSDGVRMTVDADAWSAYPRGLEKTITPIKVTIENRSDQPLRVRYNEIVLRTASGVELAALPPMDIRGWATQRSDYPVYVPRFAYSGFYVAPWYYPYYANVHRWDHPWAFDRYYYDRYYPMWRVELPTREMRERAIPEGVIEPGGRVSGFLYFPPLPRDTERVTFAADLVNGRDGNGFGKLDVPFILG